MGRRGGDFRPQRLLGDGWAGVRRLRDPADLLRNLQSSEFRLSVPADFRRLPGAKGAAAVFPDRRFAPNGQSNLDVLFVRHLREPRHAGRGDHASAARFPKSAVKESQTMRVSNMILAMGVAALSGLSAHEAQAEDQRLQSAIQEAGCAGVKNVRNLDWGQPGRPEGVVFGKSSLQWSTADFQYLYQFAAKCIAQTSDAAFVQQDQTTLHRTLNGIINYVNQRRAEAGDNQAGQQQAASGDQRMADFLNQYEWVLDGSGKSADELRAIKAEADRLLSQSRQDTPTRRRLSGFSSVIENRIAEASGRASQRSQMAAIDQKCADAYRRMGIPTDLATIPLLSANNDTLQRFLCGSVYLELYDGFSEPGFLGGDTYEVVLATGTLYLELATPIGNPNSPAAYEHGAAKGNTAAVWIPVAYADGTGRYEYATGQQMGEVIAALGNAFLQGLIGR